MLKHVIMIVVHWRCTILAGNMETVDLSIIMNKLYGLINYIISCQSIELIQQQHW